MTLPSSGGAEHPHVPRSNAARAAALTADALRPGIDWLTSEQADDARVSQFGIGTNIGPYNLMVTPSGTVSNSRGSVVVVTLREDARIYTGSYPRDLTNGIESEERDRLEAVVATFGHVLDRWNGCAITHTSTSFLLDAEISEDVRRAHRNYTAAGLTAGRLTPPVTKPEGWW